MAAGTTCAKGVLALSFSSRSTIDRIIDPIIAHKEPTMHQVRNRIALAILIVGLTAGSLHAQTPATAPAPEPSPLTFNIGVWSQYIFRGLSQTDYKPAVQGGVDYAHSSGLYVGVWASNIQWLRDFNISSGRVEVDIYGGFKKSFNDVTLDVGFLRYQYPGSVTSGAINPNTNEIYIAGSYKLATLKYSHATSNAFGTFESKHTSYWDLSAAIPIVDTWTLNTHVGYQRYRGPSYDVATYMDYKLEVVKDFGNGVSAGAGATFNDANRDFYTPPGKRSIAKDTGYAFVKYNF